MNRILALVFAASLSVVPAPAADSASAGTAALDLAFRFASAIEADRRDMGRSQAAVVSDYVAVGAYDRAVERVERVDGWYRGVARADLAAVLARQGRRPEALGLLAAAAADRQSAEGWQAERIDAHVARAQAALGDLSSAAATAGALATADRQYAGQLAATQAAGFAAQGDFEAAMAALAPLADGTDFDLTWNRTRAYLELAGEPRLTVEQRRRGAEAAAVSAEGVPGWKSAEALIETGEKLAELGLREEARATLALAEPIVAGMGEGLGARATLAANLSRAWAKAGAPERGLAAVRAAESLPRQVLLTERPAVWALLASGYHWAGDTQASQRALDAAIASAEALINARPRALAGVVICRTVGRDGLAFDASTAARMTAMLGGLQDPW